MRKTAVRRHITGNAKPIGNSSRTKVDRLRVHENTGRRRQGIRSTCLFSSSRSLWSELGCTLVHREKPMFRSSRKGSRWDSGIRYGRCEASPTVTTGGP